MTEVYAAMLLELTAKIGCVLPSFQSLAGSWLSFAQQLFDVSATSQICFPFVSPGRSIFFQVLKILVNHRWACWCCPNLVCKKHKSWLTYGNTTMIWCTCCDSNPDEIDRMNHGNPSHSHCPRFKHPLGALFWPSNFINNGPVSTFVDAQARKMCWNVWSWPWCRSRSRLSGEFLLPSLGYDMNGIGTVPATIFDPSPVSSFFIRGWMIRPSHGYVTMYVVHVSVMFL